MNQVHPKFGVPMTAGQYADEWSRSADAFFSAGHYKWMCDQLGSAVRVVEVGCGSGASTEALMATARQVLAIESNQDCADRTIARLQARGVSAELVSLDLLATLPSWNDPGVKVLMSDALSATLGELLPASWFDAIACWMTGSTPEHIGSALGLPYMQFDGSEMSTYRVRVQQRCFELGTRALRARGVVHVVDRAAIRSWADKDEMRQRLADTLSPIAGSDYTLTRSDCLLRKLSEGLNQSSIQYAGPLPPDAHKLLVLTSAKAALAR